MREASRTLAVSITVSCSSPPYMGVNRSKPSRTGREDRSSPLHCRFSGSALDGGCGRLALLEREPGTALRTDCLQPPDEGAALVRELIGHARRHLGEGAALNDPLLLQ